MHEKLKRVFEILPLKCNKIFIAGGAAHNFDLAEDVDLWIPNNAIGAAVELFNQLDYPKVSYMRDNDGENYNQAKKADNAPKFTLVGDVFIAEIGKILQILVTDRPTPLKLIQTFDLSVHMCAYTRDGVKHTSDVYYQEEVKWIDIIKLHPNTLKRYIKLCNRYGLPIMDEMSLGYYFTQYSKAHYEDPEEAVPEPMGSAPTMPKSLGGFITVYGEPVVGKSTVHYNSNTDGAIAYSYNWENYKKQLETEYQAFQIKLEESAIKLGDKLLNDKSNQKSSGYTTFDSTTINEWFPAGEPDPQKKDEEK